MKKLIYMAMGLLLCLAAFLTGCDKQKEEYASVVSEGYVETAFGMELQMVYVAGGTYMMGATEEQLDDANDDEKPAHRVTLDSYHIGKFEVTQAQWAAVMGTTVEQQYDKANLDWDLFGVGDNYPMYCVSRQEAQSFCEKLSAQTGKKYRLPTEAEWEYAARGGQKSDGMKYAGSNSYNDVAWCWENSESDYASHPVGKKRPNGLGIYDMSGNVWEWCSDWFGSYSSASAVNPQGPSSGVYCVIRGGSWRYDAQDCRVSNRRVEAPDGLSGSVGFRVVCER